MAGTPENRLNVNEPSNAIRVARIIARWFMAGIFIYASIDKIAHPAAFAKDVYNYQILPDALINLTALVLPWLELFLGLCLLAGVWMPGAVLSVNGLLMVFFSALVFNLVRGLDVNCGCFSTGSDAPTMSTTYYLLRDIGFLAVGAFLFYGVFFPRCPEEAKRASDLRLENAKGEASR